MTFLLSTFPYIKCLSFKGLVRTHTHTHTHTQYFFSAFTFPGPGEDIISDGL